MGVNMPGFLTAAVGGAACALMALAGAGMASADPIQPMPPPAPAGQAPPAAQTPLPAEAAPLSTAAGESPAAGIPAAGEIPKPEGVPHLASPDALPPGSTMDPSAQGNERPNVSYLKDLWHAVQSQEISGKEALIMGLAQRGMNTPYPEQAAGPNIPLSPVNPPAPLDPQAPPTPPGAPLPPPAPAPLSPAPAP